MADTGIFATTAEVQRKVGANASSTANVEAYINDFMTQVESHINAETEHNWSDDYAGLNVDVKGLLKEAASSLAAMYVINYDDTGFLSIAGMQTRLNVLLNSYNMAIKLLKDQNVKTFMKAA